MRRLSPALALVLPLACGCTSTSANDIPVFGPAYPCATSGATYWETALAGSGNCGAIEPQVVKAQGGLASEAGADTGDIALPDVVGDCEGSGTVSGCAIHRVCTSTSSHVTYDVSITFANDGSLGSGHFSVSRPASDGITSCFGDYDVTLKRQ